MPILNQTPEQIARDHIPASVLLERIRVEKAAQGRGVKPFKKTRIRRKEAI